MIAVQISTKFLDRGLAKALKSIANAGNTVAQVGFPSPSPQYHDSLLSLASLALIHEKGSVNGPVKIPARPFMAQTADKNKAEAEKMLAKAAQLIVYGNMLPSKAMEAVGHWYSGKMKEIFDIGTFAENAEYTKLLKGSDKPLIDTGHLRKSIRSKVSLKHQVETK